MINRSYKQYGDFVVLNTFGESHVDSLFVLRLINSLKSNLDYLIANPHATQQDYAAWVGEILSSEIIEHAHWTFDVDTNVPTPKVECVYFLRHDNYPNLIKIGQTDNLQRRVADLRTDNYNIAPVVIAYCETKEHVELEQYLHLMLHKYRRTGEFFDDVRVVEYLNSQKSLTLGQRNIQPTAPNVPETFNVATSDDVSLDTIF